MAIRIVRNEAGNCINFYGSTNPTYWNSCLSGQVDPNDSTRVNVINDIQSAATSETKYEFYQIPYTEFADKDGGSFADAQAAADYITQEGNVIGVSDVGADLTGTDVNFRLDQTSTSIIMDNGSHFGVNTIKAVPDEDGTIHIHAIGAGVPSGTEEELDHKHFEKLEHTRVSINGVSVPGGLNDVCNALNELFTVGAFQSVVISDPYSTMVADVSGTATTYSLVGSTVVDPSGDDIATNSTTGNYAGVKTTDTIDQAGEYFTFDIRAEGQIGFGLIISDADYSAGNYASGSNSTYIDPSTFAVGNSAHYGFQFSHWFHPTPNGSWTNYGAKTGFVRGPGWYNWESQDEWLAGDPVKVKVGIDENGFIAISTLQDDDTTWVMHARSSYPVPDGAEYHLGIKFANPSPRLRTAPKVHLLEAAAPTMNFRYIESPDGVYHYPLFATEEEANYYDQNHSGTTGSGTSHQHVFADDPTNTSWWMSDTGFSHDGTAEPITIFMGQAVTYTEITSLTNADLAPPAFSAADLTVDELANVNYQTQPADTAYTTSISGLPSGLTANADGSIHGTAPEVTSDLVANPSDTYTITVTRTNSYGSSTGTFDIIVNNLTPVTTAIAGFTHIGTSATMVDGDTLADGSAVTIDNVLEDGKRIVFSRSWMETYVRDTLQTGTNQKVFIGIADGSANWSSIDTPDFVFGYQFEKGSTSSGLYVRRIINGSITSNVTYSVFANDLVFYHDHSVSGYMLANLPNGGQGETVATPTYTNNGWSSVGSGDQTFVIAAVGTTMDISTSGITEMSNPTVSTNLTNWNKALDFSGSSERAQQVNSSYLYTPLKMGGTNNQVSAPATSGNTVASGHPWATAIVFSTDRNSSNQHIWNMGEGAGSTDDNIYLRTDATGKLYFGWGRSGDQSEMLIRPYGVGTGWSMTAGNWYGIYVAHNGARYGANNTTSLMADAFDIRLMGSSASWATAGYSDTNLSTASDWTITGDGRMNRSYDGDMTIGGRGTNRNFHGKVASFVSTTLRCGVAMPSTAEITDMITDPVGWVTDYKIGNAYRRPSATSDSSNFQLNSYDPAAGTQVWLMGDGASDSYSNMIRSYIYPAEQNRYKLNLISMVSNDIENVTISGLS